MGYYEQVENVIFLINNTLFEVVKYIELKKTGRPFNFEIINVCAY